MKRIVFVLMMVVSLFTVQSCQKDEASKSSPNLLSDLTCSVKLTNVTTHGGHDGTITVKVLTGNGDYIYSVSDTLTNIDGLFTRLTAGVYHIKVVDKENKQFLKDTTLTEPGLVPVKPTVEILAADSITYSTATLKGKVNPNGFNTTLVKFEYGLTTSYGTIDTLSKVTGNTLTDVTKNITGLTPSTTYHYRMVATNSGGTTPSSDVITFTTPIWKIGDQIYGGVVFDVTTDSKIWVVQKTDHSTRDIYPGDSFKLTDSNGIDWRLPSFTQMYTMYINVGNNSLITPLESTSEYWVKDINPLHESERGYFVVTHPTDFTHYYSQSASCRIRLITSF